MARRQPLVGVRARTVEVLADRGRHVWPRTLARTAREGETVRNPVSLIPALVARPRASGSPRFGVDMPDGLVEAIDRCGKADRRQALRVLGRAAGVAGFRGGLRGRGARVRRRRVPDEASCDILARHRRGAREARRASTCCLRRVPRKGRRPEVAWQTSSPQGWSPPAGGARSRSPCSPSGRGRGTPRQVETLAGYLGGRVREQGGCRSARTS